MRPLTLAGGVVFAVAWFAWKLWPAPGWDPTVIARDAVTLTDGRTLVGRYDRAGGGVELIDGRGRRGGRVAVAAAQVATVAPRELRIPHRGGAGIDGTWIADWEAAKALAVDDRVPILADFTGSDWCPWCMRLEDEVFDDPAFREWASGRVVLLKLDFPRDDLPAALAAQNDRLAEQFAISGYPAIVIIDATTETPLRRWGYVDGGFDPWVHGLTMNVPGLEALVP